MEFHILELPKLPKELQEDSNDMLLWAKFISAEQQQAEQRGILLGEQRGILLGEQRGILLGEQRGEQQKLLQMIQKKMLKLKTIEQIADELEETIETISPLYYQLKENQ